MTHDCEYAVGIEKELSLKQPTLRCGPFLYIINAPMSLPVPYPHMAHAVSV